MALMKNELAASSQTIIQTELSVALFAILHSFFPTLSSAEFQVLGHVVLDKECTAKCY